MKKFSLLCLFLVLATVSHVRAQTPPPIGAPDTYTGTVVVQQADGTTMRGTVHLSVAIYPYGYNVTGMLTFGDSGSEGASLIPLVGNLTGKRGLLHPPGPLAAGGTVYSTKIPVYAVTRQVLSGGVLAEDGSMLTFRATYDVTP